MPALPLVPNVLRTRLLWSDQDDNSVTSSLFWKYSGAGPDSTEAATLASDLSTLVAAEAALWGVVTTFLGVTVTDLSTDSGGEGTHTASVAGTDSNPGLPGAAAVLVNFQINRRYRGGKPRIYLPWGSAAHLNTRQSWESGFLGNVQTAITTITTGFVGASAGTTAITAHANVSYYEGFTTFTTPSGRVKNLSKLRTTPVVDNVVSSSVAVNISSQRRRNRAG